MSWIDRYTQDLRITTGDGKEYNVFTLPSFTKDWEYHGTDFSFVNVEGELIKKRKLKSRVFPLEFYFIGENCVEDANLFELSTRDPRPWIIEHPYYDTILAQVMRAKQDDSELNVSKITCEAKQTIADDGTSLVSNPIDVIQLKKVELDTLLSEEPNLTPSIQEIETLATTTEQNYNEGVKIITLPEQADEYFNAFNTAISTINNIAASPILAMQALTNLISLPSQFEANVQDRIRVFKDQFDNLRRTLLGSLSVPAKKLYQIQGQSTIASMCIAAINPLTGNYTNASVALQISETIKSNADRFRADLDSLQSSNGGSPESFVPSFNSMKAFNDIVSITTSSLFEIALAGRKELSYVLTEDSNVVLLTHRFYKLDPNDNNITEFCDNNSIRYRERALGLPKGKTVVYYV